MVVDGGRNIVVAEDGRRMVVESGRRVMVDDERLVVAMASVAVVLVAVVLVAVALVAVLLKEMTPVAVAVLAGSLRGSNSTESVSKVSSVMRSLD